MFLVKDLFKVLVRSNKKNYFLLFVGLSLASLFLSQIFIVSESNEAALRKFVYEEGWTESSISCSAELAFYNYYFDNNNSFVGYPVPTDFNNIIMKTISKSPLQDKLPLSSTDLRLYTYKVLVEGDNGASTILGSIEINVIPENIFQYLTPFATWENSNISSDRAVILLVSTTDLGSSQVGNFPYKILLERENVTLAVIDNGEMYSTPVTLDFSHKIIYEGLDNTEICKALNTYLFSWDASGLVITEKLFRQLLSSFNGTLQTIEHPENFLSKRIFVNAHVIHDTAKLDYTVEEFQQLLELKEQIGNNLIAECPLITSIKMMGISSDGFESFYITLRIEQLRLSFLAIPMVLFLCFLLYIQSQLLPGKKGLLAFFKNHGVTRGQWLISELVLFLSIAFLGLGLGIGVATVTVPFGYAAAGRLISLTITPIVFSGTAVLQTVGVYCAIIGLFSIPYLIFQTASISQKRQVTEKKKDAQKKQILFVILSSIVSLGLILTVILVPFESISPLFQFSSSTYFLLIVLASSITILAIYLLYQLFIDRLAKRLWRRNHNLFSFSLQNIKINKSWLKQGFLTLATGSLVIVLFLSMAFGLIATKANEARYSVGADARVSLEPKANITQIVSSLPSTIHSTEVVKLEGILNALGQQVLSFYFINTSTYGNIAYHPSSKVGLSLQKAMTYLTQTNSCLIENTRAKELSLQKDDLYSLKVQEGETVFNQQLIIADFIDAWPFFIFERKITIIGKDINAPLKIIVSAKTGSYLCATLSGLSVDRFLLLDFTDYKKDLSTITALVQNNENLQELVTFNEEYHDSLTSPAVRMLVNFSLYSGLAALLMTIGASFLFSQKLFLDQNNQLYLYLSLGASSKQLRRILIFEMLTLIVPGIIGGLMVGLFFLNYLTKIAISPTFIGEYSPTSWMLTLIVCSVFIAITGSIILTAFISVRARIKRLMKKDAYKVEEEKVSG